MPKPESEKIPVTLVCVENDGSWAENVYVIFVMGGS